MNYDIIGLYKIEGVKILACAKCEGCESCAEGYEMCYYPLRSTNVLIYKVHWHYIRHRCGYIM
jgi:hypothetical protein